jgi:DNA polymerase-3 subunit gamma/tau
MGRALYRKYRPKKLSEIVGQEHVTSTLENALKKGRISHAYLLTGPKGVGKTSAARILAYEVNGLPYDEDATHLDIIEIDAASNRRIDEIRELRQRVHNAPASAKYKVYIIDEVHMLTKEAFNALLKTLEEPPDHAIFILATTEAHKLPETIISRTQRFTFKPIDGEKSVEHLKFIAKREGIEISDEALELISAHGGGSFRDSISLLDQMGGSGAVIDLAAAQRMLGIAPDQVIDKLLTSMGSGQANDLLQMLQELYAQGYSAPQLAKQLARSLREDLLSDGRIIDPKTGSLLMRRLLDVPASHDPNALLEIILLEVVLTGAETPVTRANEKPNVKITEVAAAKPAEPNPAPEPPEDVPLASETEGPSEPPVKMPLDETAWQNVLHSIKQKHNTLYGIARMATPMWSGDELTLVFGFEFHRKRIDESKNKQVLHKIIKDVTGADVSINCILQNKSDNKKPKKDDDEPTNGNSSADDSKKQIENPDLENISNIFGSAEVLE